jgi:acetoin utilization deacetylase AcuC-like enzyme
MVTAFVSHPECRLHEMGASHPENPRRIDAITDQLLSLRLLDMLAQHDAPTASREQLLRVHSPQYLDWLQMRLPESGHIDIDLDTKMNPKTLVAAHRAAGAAILATDLVLEQRAENAFCNIRPPGHHATRDQSMGFCFFNNVALAAAHALSELYSGTNHVSLSVPCSSRTSIRFPEAWDTTVLELTSLCRQAAVGRTCAAQSPNCGYRLCANSSLK